MLYKTSFFYRIALPLCILVSVLFHGGISYWLFYADRSHQQSPNAIPIEFNLISLVAMGPTYEESFDLPDDVQQSDTAETVVEQVVEKIEEINEPTLIFETQNEVADFVQAVTEEPDLESVFKMPEDSVAESIEEQPESGLAPITEPVRERTDKAEIADKESTALQAAMPNSALLPDTSDQLMAQRTGALQQRIQDATAQWQHALHAHLARYKQYPRQAQRRQQQGSPVISFTMTRSGEVLAVRLVNGSGYIALDQEAQEMIRRAEPLPPLPTLIEGPELTVTIPINFYM